MQMPFTPPCAFFLDSFTILFVPLILVVIAILWIFQFVDLMSLEDEELPGEHARLGWVAAFLVLWMVTPFAFMLWRYRTALARTGRRADGPMSPLSSRMRSAKRRAARRAEEEAGEGAS